MSEPKKILLRRTIRQDVLIVVREGETQEQAVKRVLSFGLDQVPWTPHDDTIHAAIGRGARQVYRTENPFGGQIHNGPGYNPDRRLPDVDR